MSIYDINYQTFAQNNTPPPRRKVGFLAWVYSILYSLQWLHDIIYGSYWLGSTDPQYLLANTYTKGQRVIYWNQAGGSYYGDNAVYEANGAVPINTPPIAANMVNALGVGYWIKVQSNFIGVNERQSYSVNKIIFEYALNRWFHTTFKQPGTGTSDIYIVTNLSNQSQLYVFSQPNGNYLFNSWQASNKYVFAATPAINAYDFTIYVPVAIYNALDNEAPVLAGSNTARRDGIVKSFANQYTVAGMNYNIITY